MAKRIGKYTVKMENKPAILSWAAVTGQKEAEGPIGKFFDKTFEDSNLGEDTWEKAESRLQTEAVTKALEKANLTAEKINMIFAGDLLNQCISSTFGLRSLNIPFLGQYGACSTMAQTLAMSSFMVESGIADHTVAVTSSHFCSAEKQFRFPLQYGSQRKSTTQWTVTASGAAVLGKAENNSEHKNLPRISAITIGKIMDLGIKDQANMGAAMAPAAASTFKNFLEDSNTSVQDYDLILTGDLGKIGSQLFSDLLHKENINLGTRHKDCGIMIYSDEQNVKSGGSGCGCSASVLCSKILNQVQNNELKNILFIATGALMSPTSSLQGESIPGIAHLINMTN